MAQVTVITPPPAPARHIYQLILNQEELDVLFAVGALIGGDPSTSRRGIFDRIFAAVKPFTLNKRLRPVGYAATTDADGYIYFEDRPAGQA